MHYITNYLIYSSLIYVLLEGAFLLSIFFHEIGHAIPALLFTKGKVNVYIGSLGDQNQSVTIRIGRLHCFIKYNPLLWVNGICVSDTINSIDKRIIMIAAGPVASLLLATFILFLLIHRPWIRVTTWYLVITAAVSFYNAILAGFPRKKLSKTYTGKMIPNDGSQIANLLVQRQ